MHAFLVIALSACVLSLVFRLMRLWDFITRPRVSGMGVSDAIGDVVFALVSGGVGALVAWLLVKWE